MPQQIIMIVSPDGKTEMTVEGVKGGRCLELTKPYEAGLGPALYQTKTADFYDLEDVAIEMNTGKGHDPDA